MTIRILEIGPPRKVTYYDCEDFSCGERDYVGEGGPEIRYYDGAPGGEAGWYCAYCIEEYQRKYMPGSEMEFKTHVGPNVYEYEATMRGVKPDYE